VGVHSALSFARFQALVAQRTGRPAELLSSVFVCRKTVGDVDKQQKLPVSEATRFSIYISQHPPSRERDAHFLVSLKKSKKDRKVGARKRTDAGDEEEEEEEESAPPPSPEKSAAGKAGSGASSALPVSSAAQIPAGLAAQREAAQRERERLSVIGRVAVRCWLPASALQLKSSGTRAAADHRQRRGTEREPTRRRSKSAADGAGAERLLCSRFALGPSAAPASSAGQHHAATHAAAGVRSPACRGSSVAGKGGRACHAARLAAQARDCRPAAFGPHAGGPSVWAGGRKARQRCGGGGWRGFGGTSERKGRHCARHCLQVLPVLSRAWARAALPLVPRRREDTGATARGPLWWPAHESLIRS